MLRLTVGRRLALVVAFSIIALTIVVLLVLRGQASEARSQAEEFVDGVAVPTASFIAADLEMAGDQLAEIAARTTAAERAGDVAISNDDYLTFEIVPDGEASELNATSNVLERARVDTVIGSTRTFDETVAVLIATPLPPTDGTTQGTVLVAAYDASDLIERIINIGEETATEALLAVRNSAGNVVVFTPSLRSDGEPLGEIGSQAQELVDRVLGGENELTTDGVNIDGVDSVVSVQRITGVEWLSLIHI